MNKTANLVLFMIIATVFNVVLMMGLALGIFLLVSSIPGLAANEALSVPLLLLGLVGAVVLTFVIYGWLMKKVSKRFKLEQHVPQLFKTKKK